MCAEFVLSKTSCKIYIALDIVNLPIILKNTQPIKYHMFAYFQQNLSATALDQRGQKGIVLYLCAHFNKTKWKHLVFFVII